MPGDSRAIAEAVAAVGGDDALRGEMSANALLRSTEFTVEKYGERLLAAIEAVSFRGERTKPTSISM
jgi:glycosyltransferase involved in cell wall biosynthesis